MYCCFAYYYHFCYVIRDKVSGHINIWLIKLIKFHVVEIPETGSRMQLLKCINYFHGMGDENIRITSLKFEIKLSFAPMDTFGYL